MQKSEIQSLYELLKKYSEYIPKQEYFELKRIETIMRHIERDLEEIDRLTLEKIQEDVDHEFDSE